jgi:twitching motility protein PilT
VAQLNRFIEILHQRGADALTLSGGAPIGLTAGGVTKPVTQNPLEVAQVLALIKEIAPPDLRTQIRPGADVTFQHRSPSGDVDVELRPDNGSLTATVRARPASGQAGPPTATAPQSAAAQTRRDADADRGQLDELLRLLVRSGGSDLHLRVGEPAVLRKDGALDREKGAKFDADQLRSMLESIMPPKDLKAFREAGDADYAYELEGVARFRCNAAMDRRGPMGVFRVIPSEIPTCEQLDVSQAVQKLCYLTKGLVVVTGPTGSGKSTTLAALVNLMNRERNDHILTIEDPIEFVHQSQRCLVTHRQVGLHTRSFKTGLRAALREDPDIVLIGEMRDLETVEIAIETAETGHLVFATLHTTTATSTVDRIIDQFSADRQAQIRVMLSESLRGVIAQVLCRKKTGGRVAAREIMLTTPAVSNLIREGKTFQLPSIIQTSKQLGMSTLNDALVALVEQGIVEPKEAYMKAVDKAGIETAFKAKGHKLSLQDT